MTRLNAIFRTSAALLFAALSAAPQAGGADNVCNPERRVFCIDCLGAIAAKSDPEQTVRLISAPAGAELLEKPGVVAWVPSEIQAGEHHIKVVITGEEREYVVEVKPLERVLFVFAHSDDEFPILSKLYQFVRLKKEVRCLWLVSGSLGRAESTKAMAEIGLPTEKLTFLRENLASLESLQRASEALRKALREYPADQVFIPQYEGGHFQHDMAHFCAVDAALRGGFKGQIYEFGLYNLYGGLPRPFSLIPSVLPHARYTQSDESLKTIEALIPVYASQRHVTAFFQALLSNEQRKNTCYRPASRWDFTRPPHQGRLWLEFRPNSPSDNIERMTALARKYLETHPRKRELPGIFTQDRERPDRGADAGKCYLDKLERAQ